MRPGGSAAGAPAAVVSPVVTAGKVTFRLRAAEAKTVTVSGDFGPDVALSRGSDGVWSATVGPLKSDVYVYYFSVDGVRLPDPANPQVKIGYVPSTTTSIVNVPGDGPAFYDVQDVPHGEIRTLLYKSRSNQVVRELNVYLPPGYDANSRQRYPVLYLLHGFANDHHSWHRYGRANDILDNLLAKNAIKPFIVVMPLGYGGASVNGDGTGIPPAGAGQFGGDFALYERDILEDIIPLIDGKYRTLANRENRAIMGFSMGGMQAGRFGLAHLDTFSYVGIMSAGLIGNPASAAVGPDPIAALAAHPAAVNKQLKLLWIACGREDTAMTGARGTHEALQKAGIQHVFVESDGAHHWRVWRHYLHDVAPLLFR
jgi:enterochelin esterase family protein